MPDRQPFEGIRILDLTHVLAGPFATYQLALLGAEVIKIENPTDPDMARFWGLEPELNQRAMGTAFLTQGGNKRALALDLREAEDREILLQLVATADVLVENYRPGALAALGVDVDALAGANPQLVHVSMSAFGQSGPRGSQTAYDYVVQAATGIMAMTGTPQVNPIKIGPPAIDYATGTTGAFAIAAALFQRARTGRGQRIDLAMYDVGIILQSLEVTSYTRTGHHPEPRGNSMTNAACNAYPTRDGLVMLGAANMKQYHRMWQALGRPEAALADYEARAAGFEAEEALLGEILSARTADEWEAFFQAHGVPAARVRRLHEALDDAQMHSRRVTARLETPDLGSMEVPLAAFRMDHGGPALRSPPPQVGADSEAILAELGLDATTIAAFRQRQQRAGSARRQAPAIAATGTGKA